MNVKQSNYIKIIAILSMFSDHMGKILFPNITVFQIIGRLAFPLFAYQICIGYLHTKNCARYIQRLFISGTIFQLFYVFAIYALKIDENPLYLNIFFTLGTGLSCITLYEKGRFPALFFILFLISISEFLPFSIDYGLYGVCIILFFHINSRRRLETAALLTLITLAYCFFILGGNYLQMYSVFALIFIFKPLEVKVNIPKYFFYVFYPLHLLLLYSISMLITIL